jgi:hypothetical protein
MVECSGLHGPTKACGVISGVLSGVVTGSAAAVATTRAGANTAATAIIGSCSHNNIWAPDKAMATQDSWYRANSPSNGQKLTMELGWEPLDCLYCSIDQ